MDRFECECRLCTHRALYSFVIHVNDFLRIRSMCSCTRQTHKWKQKKNYHKKEQNMRIRQSEGKRERKNINKLIRGTNKSTMISAQTKERSKHTRTQDGTRCLMTLWLIVIFNLCPYLVYSLASLSSLIFLRSFIIIIERACVFAFV